MNDSVAARPRVAHPDPPAHNARSLATRKHPLPIHRSERRKLLVIVGLALTLVVELCVVTAYPRPITVSAGGAGLTSVAASGALAIRMTIAVMVFAALAFAWEPLASEVSAATGAASAKGRKFWIALNLISFLAFVVWARASTRYAEPRNLSSLAIGLAFASATVVSWGAALMPARSWSRFAMRAKFGLALAVVTGLAANLLSVDTRALWPMMAGATLTAVAFVLRAIGQTVISGPAPMTLGTPYFSVEVLPACSGIEGIGLIVLLTAGYLWLARGELKFPNALALIPIGAAIIWTLNVVRIAMLIMIGSRWPDFAVNGFHSNAGWLAFNATAFAMLVASRRVGFFTRERIDARDLAGENRAAVYLVPFIVWVTASIISRMFAIGFDALYPIRVLAVGVAIFAYRRSFTAVKADVSASSIAFGALAFSLWMIFARSRDANADNRAFAAGLSHLATLSRVGWLSFRVAGAVAVAPIAEEFAFRGYLMRKLTRADFDSVSYKEVSVFAIVASSVLFAAIHQQLVAGFLAGLVFAFAARYRGRLADAVVAHAAANAILAAWVIATNSWWLWG